jgi:hypothetical protein
MKLNKGSIIYIIALIVILLMVNDYLNKETTFQIRKFNVSRNTSAEYVTDDNMKVDIDIVNITIEGLEKYPGLVGAIDNSNKTTDYSRYSIHTDDWKIINDFIKSKYKNLNYGNISPCIKFGGIYGDTCYQILSISRG